MDNAPRSMSTEDVERAVEILADNREAVIDFAAEQIAKGVDAEEVGSVSMDDTGAEATPSVVATDGGSLFLESATEVSWATIAVKLPSKLTC